MLRTAVALLTLAFAVTGCDTVVSGTPRAAAPIGTSVPTTTTTRTTTTTTTPPLPGAKDGSNVRACFDGTCEIAVAGPLDIPFDGRYGVYGISVVAIAPGGVDLMGSTGGMTGNFLSQRPDQGGPSTLNELSFSVVAISGTTAVIAFFPAA